MPILTKRPHSFGWILQIVSHERAGVECFYSKPEDEAATIESAWKAWRQHG